VSKLTEETQITSEIPSEAGISEVVQVSDLPVDSLLIKKNTQENQTEGDELSRAALKKEE
jgi:hypothetical protein